MTIIWHELKINLKSLLIWSWCIGLISFGCILLFESFADTMKEMAEAYAQMGNFSAALGMDRMNIGTMEGFYATEVALVFAVGGAMFSAMTGAVLLSKEEEGHTAEFLYTLPFGRRHIVLGKYLSMILLIFCFQVICILCEIMGFLIAGEMPPVPEYAVFHGAQFLMQVEIGSVCFLISSLCRRKQIGAALGLAVLLYMMDMLCRIVPDIENLKYITPYYFSNAADIFTTGKTDGVMAGIAAGIVLAAAASAIFLYGKRDIVS